MSDNAKTLNITYSDTLKVVKTVIDFEVQDGSVGCHSIDSYAPKYHKLVDTEIFVETALSSDGSATVSIGFDDIATEPDNILNDEAVASFTAGALIANTIPKLGTAATHVDVGTSDAQQAYEIKVAAINAGKMIVVNTYKPYK